MLQTRSMTLQKYASYWALKRQIWKCKMEFPYTAATIGAILIILQQVLMMIAGTHRGKVSIGVGFGDDKDLERKIRRHGNLAENAAIFVVVLSLAESLVGSETAIIAFGVIFLIARISHAIAFSSLAGSHGVEGASKVFVRCRMLGALGNGLSGIGLGLYLIFLLLA